MKPAKCITCGANIEVDESRDAGICPYCNTAYVTEKAIANYANNVTNNATTIINNYYNGVSANVTQPKVESKSNPVIKIVEPRPKINVWLAILGFYFYIIPGIIYVCHIKQKQKEWDEMHNNQQK